VNEYQRIALTLIERDINKMERKIDQLRKHIKLAQETKERILREAGENAEQPCEKE